MSQTIIGQFLGVGDDDLEDTTKYLEQLGMIFNNSIAKELFYIELKELPAILFKLLQNGYLDIRANKEFTILKISNSGVLLYIVSSYGDGYVFLSRENIISIHTLSEEFLDAVK